MFVNSNESSPVVFASVANTPIVGLNSHVLVFLAGVACEDILKDVAEATAFRATDDFLDTVWPRGLIGVEAIATSGRLEGCSSLGLNYTEGIDHRRILIGRHSHHVRDCWDGFQLIGSSGRSSPREDPIATTPGRRWSFTVGLACANGGSNS